MVTQTSVPTGTALVTQTAVATGTAMVTSTPQETETAEPTETAGATETAEPTETAASGTVSICHRTGSGRYNEITINENAVEAHQRHGDIIPAPPGGCPSR
jgi:hypothetical protein